MPLIPLPSPTIPLLPVAVIVLAAKSTEDPPLNLGPTWGHRSLLNILFSCITTLLLCAWTVLHLDVPTRKQGWFTKARRKFGWFCVALFAPHILLIIAFNQRYMATAILKKIQEYKLDFPDFLPSRYRRLRRGILGYFLFGPCDNTQSDDLLPILGSDEEKSLGAESSSESGSVLSDVEEKKSDKPRRKHAWGMRHAFYACMGGYTFDFTDSVDPPFLPCGDTSITITPFGIVWLMQHYPDLIPDVPVEFIEDRSKSDALAKALVILQVLWFCTNLIARRASDLPISLLEISTLAHAINSLLIYILWWDKPHDVSQPSAITGSQAREACALMSMLSPTCRPILAGLWTLRCHGEWSRYLDRRDNIATQATPSSDGSVVYRGQGVTASIFTIQHDYSPRDVPSEWTLANFRLSRLFGSKSPRPWYIVPQTAGCLTDQSGQIALGQVDLARWRLASDAVLFLEALKVEVQPHRKQEPLLTRHSTPAAFFRNLSSFELLGEHNGLPLRIMEDPKSTLTVSAALALYGAPHLFGWSTQYPTSVERMLWQASVIALLCPIASALVIGALYAAWIMSENSGTTVLALALYPAASAYLVVESFRQLLYLPDAAYDIPSWSEMWPHVA